MSAQTQVVIDAFMESIHYMKGFAAEYEATCGGEESQTMKAFYPRIQ